MSKFHMAIINRSKDNTLLKLICFIVQSHNFSSIMPHGHGSEKSIPNKEQNKNLHHNSLFCLIQLLS